MNKFLTLLLLVAGPAVAQELEIINHAADLNNKLDVVAEGVLVGRRVVSLNVSGVVVPPRTAGSWHDIRLCHDEDETDEIIRKAVAPSIEIKLKGQVSSCKVSRIVSRWGTSTGTNSVQETYLQRAKQVDRFVQFANKIVFHPNWSITPANTNGYFTYLGARSAFPVGTAAIWMWSEAQRASGYGDAYGLGIAQCNVLMGNEVVEGTSGQEGWAFRNHAKMLSRVDQQDWGQVSRVPTIAGAKEDLVVIQVGLHSKCLYYGWGYEMRTFAPVYLTP